MCEYTKRYSVRKRKWRQMTSDHSQLYMYMSYYRLATRKQIIGINGYGQYKYNVTKLKNN